LSRIPRFQEHLKTGFTAEAVSAARYRAYAARAEQDGLPQLAARWLRLAAEKDQLAMRLLAAAEQVRGQAADLGAAIAEERYENDVLYPKMIRDLAAAADDPAGAGAAGDRQAAAAFRQLLATQAEHLREMEGLRDDLSAARGDVQPPPAAAAAPPARGTAGAAAPPS
jgi:rubrerythrin